MTDTIDQLRDELTARIRSHPFLRCCRDGTVTAHAMRTFLEQQALYSQHFTRFLCALMSRLQGNDQVLALAANLFEELGLDGAETIPHSEIYRDMLRSFGIAQPADDMARPETRALIAEMYELCRDDDCASGLGALCLGAEALVPAVYGDILLGLKALGYRDEDCVFFQIHVDCDDGHAETMEQIMIEIVTKSPHRIPILTTAGRRIVEARYSFFDGILTHAGQQLANVG